MGNIIIPTKTAASFVFAKFLKLLIIIINLLIYKKQTYKLKYAS